MKLIDAKDYDITQRIARPLDPHERAVAGDDDEAWDDSASRWFVGVCTVSVIFYALVAWWFFKD